MLATYTNLCSCFHLRPSLRIIALTLFSLTLLKLFLYDIRGISEGGKIAAFPAHCATLAFMLTGWAFCVSIPSCPKHPWSRPNHWSNCEPCGMATGLLFMSPSMRLAPAWTRLKTWNLFAI